MDPTSHVAPAISTSAQYPLVAVAIAFLAIAFFAMRWFNARLELREGQHRSEREQRETAHREERRELLDRQDEERKVTLATLEKVGASISAQTSAIEAMASRLDAPRTARRTA